jgi:hypothetical protein
LPKVCGGEGREMTNIRRGNHGLPEQERLEPLSASMILRRVPGIADQTKRAGIENDDLGHQLIPFNAGGKSLR